MASSTLFISLGNSAPAWYRCALPANYIDADWIGTIGYKEAPGVIIAGNMEEDNPDYDSYETIIVQQVSDKHWLKWIKERQSNGQTILYEIDDFIHGIHNIADHRFKSAYSKKRRKLWQMCMEQCDGMICSTQFLADQYKKYNVSIEVCENAIDTARYDVEFPDREEKIVIGWAGGTGHNQAVKHWLPEIHKILETYSYVSFISIGAQYADLLATFHPGKTLSIPWGTIENFPYLLTHFDITLAPVHDSKYFRSKSDLRWLEASAVGTPTVAGVVDGSSPYASIQDYETGLLAHNPEEAGDCIMELIESQDLRASIASNAQKYVRNNRDIEKNAQNWQEAISKLSA